MDADAFRHLYGYHFAENRKLWDAVTALSDEDLARGGAYSHGSVCDQIRHLIDVDDAWFSGLRGDAPPEPSEPTADRAALRRRWDDVEDRMRAYLAGMQDGMLDGRPFPEGEDADLRLWQVLIHVVNHGTDHRAQVLRQLNDLGVPTEPQDYVFYAYEEPLG
jgi:uncharacterized damage-inducible protein DinB